MHVKIWLPWKRQIAWAKTCHTKLLPDKFWEKSPRLVAFASILEKLLTFKVSASTFCPLTLRPNRVKYAKPYRKIPVVPPPPSPACKLHWLQAHQPVNRQNILGVSPPPLI